MDMSEYKELVLVCPNCDHQSQIYYGLYQSSENELVAVWRCGQCKKDCLAIIAGMKPVNPFFTSEDVEFLHSCNCHITEG